MSTASETFALPDVRCAGCVLKIERSLAGLPGVELARGNATQKRMRVVWDEAVQSLDSVRDAILGLGYQAEQIAVEAPVDTGPALLPRLGVAAVGMMNIMAFSMSVWFGAATDMGPSTMQYMHWLSAAIAVPMALYSGSIFHGPALRALRHGHMTMDTPISLAILVTLAASLVETFRGAEHVYFDAVIALIFFLLIGRVLERLMHEKSGDAAANLRGLMDVRATRLEHDGTQTTLAATELIVGDTVLVKTGERVPADGTLFSDHVHVDESVLTGETKPKAAAKGAGLAAGAIVLDGPVEVRVTHVGEASEIGQLAQMAEEVMAHKGRLQRMSDQFARGYIPLVLGGGSLGFLMWFFAFGASFGDSLMIAVAVLIVTCPCAAGLATPAVTSRAMNLALKAGIVVKSGAALEQLGDIDQVFLDKTGTASLPKLAPAASLDAEVLGAARALAAASAHPLARALDDGSVAAVTDAKEVAGQGIEGPDGARLGSAAFVGTPNDTSASLFYRAHDGAVTPITFEEHARLGLSEFLSSENDVARPVTLLSGDSATAVERFANSAGVADWLGRQTPADKLNILKAAQAEGDSVMMIGDGINDTVALSAADVSVSFAEATQIAQTSADIVLTQPDLRRVSQAMALSRRARRLIHQNLTFSTVYNVLTVPLALAGLLSPALAALLMSASSIVVMANGYRLRGVK